MRNLVAKTAPDESGESDQAPAEQQQDAGLGSRGSVDDRCGCKRIHREGEDQDCGAEDAHG